MSKIQNIDLSVPSTIKRRFAINKALAAKILVFFSFFLLTADIVYKSYYGITYQTRENCILYDALPRWVFLIYEYFIELLIVVVIGVFAAVLIEKYFSRFQPFIPKNPLTAFLAASAIPVCSCSAIPLIKALNDKIRLRTVITFVVAAPLLNPYIIILSGTVLGLRYVVLRILSSLILAVATGYIVEFFHKRLNPADNRAVSSCRRSELCPGPYNNIYQNTYIILREIFPFLLLAGFLGVIVELGSPGQLLKSLNLDNHIVGTLLIMAIGVPVYFCNGADVLFLQPLLQNGYLPMGTAMAFSLTSTSVCITSLVLLVRFIGKRMTLTILTCIVVLTLILSTLIQLIPV